MYQAKRRQFSLKSQSTFRHHAAWGVLCVLLILVVMGLWTLVQSLQSEKSQLQQQLASVQSASTQSTCKPVGTWTANTTKQQTIATPYGNRDYLVHLPQKFSDSKYYPLLMFYPGKSATAAGAQAAYGLDQLPAIVVYPFPTVGQDGFTAWEGAPYSSSADDVAFTASIIDKVQSDLCIDRTRIYAAGMSNGGGFASVLSCKLPDRFAAYAVVAGAMYYPTGECKTPRPSPLISIHSDSDPIVPYDGSSIRHLPPIYNWTAMRAAMNGCKTTQTDEQQATITTTTWTDCKNDAIVQNIVVHGGGHTWGQVSNNYLWQFLSRFKS